MSKDIKPKHRLGQTAATRRNARSRGPYSSFWLGSAAFYGYRYATQETKVEVPVAKVRTAEFVIAVRTRGEIRSVNSVILAAPQVPDPRIVRIAESGKPIHKGEVVVEFDAAQQEQNLLERNTTVRTVDSEIIQTKASHRMIDEQDAMNLMTAQYNLERAKLDASKAEVVSQIEGAKSRLDVGISEGELKQVNTVLGAHDDDAAGGPRPLAAAQRQDRPRRGPCEGLPDEDGADGAAGRNRQHPSELPRAGIVRFRAAAVQGRRPRLDRSAIAEIPDLSNMRIDLKLEEVDRGKLKLGQTGSGSHRRDRGS